MSTALAPSRGTQSDRLFAELRCLRLDDGRDPFAEYQAGRVSKGWLLAQIVRAVKEKDNRTCPACHGSGIGRAPGPYVCTRCAGAGTVTR